MRSVSLVLARRPPAYDEWLRERWILDLDGLMPWRDRHGRSEIWSQGPVPVVTWREGGLGVIIQGPAGQLDDVIGALAGIPDPAVIVVLRHGTVQSVARIRQVARDQLVEVIRMDAVMDGLTIGTAVGIECSWGDDGQPVFMVEDL